MSGIPAPGQVIDRYQVEGVIGAGSMGDVIKATDIDLKRAVAIKVLSDKHRGNEELEARFVREGRAVAAISHSNVVQVFTTGTYDSRPYIAMEFLTGTDLGSLVAQTGPMSSLDAALAVLDSALGLEAAYEAGLIHRDVKPANLVKLDNGKVKVTDFGLAKPVDPKNEPALTAMGVVVGTPDYIAPEQARGEAIDEKVDIYALGGTLYYLLVGKPPFRKGNPLDDKYLKVVARHLRDPAPNPMLVVPDVDGDLARLQLRLMSKKPEARPSYTELIAELGQITERLGGRTKTPVPPSGRTPNSGPGRAGPSAKTPYLGGNRQSTDITRLADEQARAETARPDDDGAETNLHMPSGQHAAHRHPPVDTPVPGPGHQGSAQHSQQVSAQHGSAQQAQQVSAQHGSAQQASAQHSRQYSQQVSAQHSAAIPPARSKLLVASTVLCALAFAVSLILYLAGPIPSASTAASVVAIDAAPVAVVVATPDAAPAPPPTAPEGMLLLPADGERPASFISKAMVSYGEFAEMFPNQKKPTKKKSRANAPVTSVDFAYAQAFARTKGGRLPSPAELLAASGLEETVGFKQNQKLSEWLDDGTEGTQAKRMVGNHRGEPRSQRPKANNSVGFRVIIDL